MYFQLDLCVRTLADERNLTVYVMPKREKYWTGILMNGYICGQVEQ